MATYQGGCHCGRVRFEVDAEIDAVTLCDCSICSKKGIVHIGVPDERFRMLSGESELSLYQFGSNVACHWFCRRCGIHPFGRPRTSPDRYTVNARCLDDYETIAAAAAERRFDGRDHPRDRD